jgi:hypothetical protein
VRANLEQKKVGKHQREDEYEKEVRTNLEQEQERRVNIREMMSTKSSRSES